MNLIKSVEIKNFFSVKNEVSINFAASKYTIIEIGDRQIILDTCLFQVLDEHCRKSARKGDIAGEFLTSYLISNSSAFGVSKDEFC